MYDTKEENLYSKCYKMVLCAGPKSARNILPNFSLNPARNPKSPARLATLSELLSAKLPPWLKHLLTPLYAKYVNVHCKKKSHYIC